MVKRKTEILVKLKKIGKSQKTMSTNNELRADAVLVIVAEP